MSTGQKLVGKFEIQAVLARGPRAQVLRGLDTETQKPVALKVITRDAIDARGLATLKKSAEDLWVIAPERGMI